MEGSAPRPGRPSRRPRRLALDVGQSEVRCSMLDARWWHSGWFRVVRVFGGSIGFSGFNSFDVLLLRRSHATTLPTSAGHAAKTAPPSLLDNRLLDSPLATSASRHSEYQRNAAPHAAFCHSAGFRSRTVSR